MPAVLLHREGAPPETTVQSRVASSGGPQATLPQGPPHSQDTEPGDDGGPGTLSAPPSSDFLRPPLTGIM